ncbi:hypothetical protein [uncultured Flavobacterium sp.]|uniref:hypothetical protein n=1 Tax=uncultured Flavobacterium sp. TaxID=165435 RepID=UPI0030C7DA6C
MASKNQEKIEELYSYLKTNFETKGFGLRDGYIYSGFSRKIHFELFVDYLKIGLKYPIPNISEKKFNSLNQCVSEINSDFIHRTYNTVPKNKYHVWEIDVSNLSYNEIGKLIIALEAYTK